MVTQTRTVDWDPSHPAPGRLEQLRRFANSLDCYRGRDELADLDRAQALIRRLDGTATPGVTESWLPDLRQGRAALRAVVGCSTLWQLPSPEGSAQPEAVGSYAVSLALSASAQGLDVLSGSDTAEGFLALLFLELLITSRTGAARRLKPCANVHCQWVFWDSSRPGSGRWCSMQVCGGQAKTRRYRDRQGLAQGD